MQIIQAVMAFLASADFNAYVVLALGLLGALLAIALAVPGDSPDKQLQAAIDFIKKFSRK